jgi:hypothetical protein
MQVVAIHGWQEETPALAQALAAALGVTAYEARQRLIGGGPAVVACFADLVQAKALAAKLMQGGLTTLVVDATAAVRTCADCFAVRRFVPGDRSLRAEAAEGAERVIAYGEIALLLRTSRILAPAVVESAAERQLSLARAALTGGLLATRKVKGREEVAAEEREEVLYLFTGSSTPVVFASHSMHYERLGAAMKPSREMNFLHLVTELLRLCPAAIYDDRLARRVGQVHLLGPLFAPEAFLPLAVEILARSLRRSGDGTAE